MYIFKFPKEWKKGNVVPVHKKSNEQINNNYRPALLLPICTKVSEKIIFNCLFKYLDTNSLLNNNQSGFHRGDSCVHPLPSVMHDVYKAFDASPSLEIIGVFLYLSKAFDRVSNKVLMYKLKCLRICEKFHGLIHSFLSDRQ